VRGWMPVRCRSFRLVCRRGIATDRSSQRPFFAGCSQAQRRCLGLGLWTQHAQTDVFPPKSIS
jgi:hypothetical protein